MSIVPSTKRDWTVHAEVRVLGGQPQPGDVRNLIPTSGLALSSVAVAYPVIPDTASSTTQPHRYKGELWVGNIIVDTEARIEEGYQGLSSIAIWDAKNVRAPDITLKVNVATTCYETRIDERIARGYVWPKHPWGPELSLCLDPQLFVESLDPVVQELTHRWTNNGKPRDAKPYDLAKHLAAQCLLHFRRTQGNYEAADRTPGDVNNIGVLRSNAFITGFRVNGAAYSARTGEGSQYDLPCLLTAVYRAAGIPARMVIGFDIEKSDEERQPVLRVWVEFFLPRDPPQPKDVDELVPVRPTDGEWVPVHITRQQEFASRAPPLTQRWQYFGYNDESDFTPPISLHWLPPSTLTNAGPAAIWGWLPQPGNPLADQELRFWHLDTPKRGDDPPDVKRQ